MSITQSTLVRQHLIDPEICIRCNTCEEMCPVDAITHDSCNYVVNFELCHWCNACLAPCPTGAIDSIRHVPQNQPFSVAEQLVWDILPETSDYDQQSVSLLPSTETEHTSDAQQPRVDAANQTQAEKIQPVHTEHTEIPPGQNAPVLAPYSAAHPYINLYGPKTPIIATISGNYRLTTEEASSDIHHIILDFGIIPFPVLEGQSLGIIPPGTDAQGKPHLLRMYSVASPRDGERPGYNNVALTVKRVTEDYLGTPVRGVCSNYLCDLKKGDKVQVTGPYGSTFLMPNHTGSSLIMICSGTGSAPMRAMTEHRRRIGLNEGERLVLFFGARTPNELPYFGPLQKLPQGFIDINFAFSRVVDQPKKYVQDLIRHKAAQIISMLNDEHCYIYICGLKAMEAGVLEAFSDVCCAHGMDWKELHPLLLKQARFHVETY